MKPKCGYAAHTEKSKTPFPSHATQSNSKLNIHDIIDDAMNKKDRNEKIQIKRRLRNKQYLIVERGAAKTLYDSTIYNYIFWR